MATSDESGSGRPPQGVGQGEASELQEQGVVHGNAASSAPEGRQVGRQETTKTQRALGFVKSFWKRHVFITVSHEGSRDHFALERTYLGYFRTSIAFSILGVTIAQLFRLQKPAAPNLRFGFFVLGIPLACACIGAALLVVVLGAYRFWRQQNALARGKVHAGGWELNFIALATALVTLSIFVLIVAVDIDKETG